MTGGPPPAEWPCPSCGDPVPINRFACRKDWLRLPATYRHAIGRAWDDRCAGKDGATRAHVAAKTAATHWYQRNPA